jgi:hypothetical protein
MNIFTKRAGLLILSAALWLCAAGVWRTARVSAQTKHSARKAGQPKTVIHVVVYKWKDGVSEADKQKVLAGIAEMGRKIPGIKNVWLKTQRSQLQDMDGVFAMEFASAEAAADYAESPVHEAWSKRWLELRQSSFSFQATNP